MDELAEKRVFADRAGATTVLVGATPGLVRVSVSDARVGEFGVVEDCAPADIAAATDHEQAGGFRLAVATDEDVLLGAPGEDDALEPSGFGPAVAVTLRDGRPLAAGPEGRLAAYDDGWSDVGELPAPATALAGDLIGTAEGVVRLVDGSLRPAGLTDVNDVALAAGCPLAATMAGLYELGNGWLDVVDGSFDLVAGAPDGRAHAATAEAVFERIDGTWSAVELPTDTALAAVAYGPRTYLLDSAGDLHVETADGFDRTPLGLEGVVAAAVVRPG